MGVLRLRCGELIASCCREEKDWDFGTGAGFYLTATSEAYKKHYNMYEHIVNEIPEILEKADIGIVSRGPSLPFRLVRINARPGTGSKQGLGLWSLDGRYVSLSISFRRSLTIERRPRRALALPQEPGTL